MVAWGCPLGGSSRPFPQTTKIAGEVTTLQKSCQEKQDKINATQESLKTLQAQFAQGPEWTPEQRAKKRDLEAEINQIRSFLKDKLNTQSALERDVGVLKEHIRVGTEAIAALHREKDEVAAQITAVTRSTASMESKKGVVDADMRSLQNQVDGLRGAVADKEAVIQAAETEVAKLERVNKVLDAKCTQELQNCTVVMKRAEDSTSELDALILRMQALAGELNDIEARTAKYRQEESAVNSDAAKSVKLHDLCVRKLAELQSAQEAVCALATCWNAVIDVSVFAGC